MKMNVLQAQTEMDNCLSDLSIDLSMTGTVHSPNQDLRRQKRTDGRELLSMGRHIPVATDMNTSLTKVRDRVVASYLKTWYRLH
jgi:hypothetical protein